MSTKPAPWTALIPLRGGSKGLPGKNTRLLAGQPLYMHSVKLALAAGAQRVVITTDIDQVLTAALPANVQAIHRPAALAGDAVPMAPVLTHAIEHAHLSGLVVLLQATSPLRQVSDVHQALAVYARGSHELVMSVTEADRGVLKWGLLDGTRFMPLADPSFCFSNRQSLPPVYRPNGAVYVFAAPWFAARGSFVTERIGVVQMPAERSFDIDTLADFDRCETLLTSTVSDLTS